MTVLRPVVLLSVLMIASSGATEDPRYDPVIPLPFREPIVWMKLDRSPDFCPVSPDGKWVAVQGSDREKAELRLIDRATKRAVRRFPRGTMVAFTPDSKRLVTLRVRKVALPLKEGEHGEAFVTEVSTGKIIVVIPLRRFQGIGYINFHALGNDVLVIAGKQETGTVYDLKTGKTLGDLPGKQRLQQVSLSRDGRWLLGLAGKSLYVWDVKNRKAKGVLYEHAGRVRAIAISPDGKWCASLTKNNYIWVFNRETGVEKARTSTLFRNGHGRALQFTADGKTLVAGGFGIHHGLQLWDWETSAEIRGGFPKRGYRGANIKNDAWNWAEASRFTLTDDGKSLFEPGDQGVYFIDLRKQEAVPPGAKSLPEAKKP